MKEKFDTAPTGALWRPVVPIRLHIWQQSSFSVYNSAIIYPNAPIIKLGERYLDPVGHTVYHKVLAITKLNKVEVGWVTEPGGQSLLASFESCLL